MTWWSEELVAGCNGGSITPESGNHLGQDGYQHFKDGVFCMLD